MNALTATTDVVAQPKGRTTFFFWTALAISATAFLGFSSTYFGPLLRGEYPDVSPTVHLHGWAFFAWYLLLPLQAGLVRVRQLGVHRALGLSSVALAAIMVVTGLIVVGARVEAAQGSDGSAFWKLMGPGVFSTLVVFTAFYIAAIRYRRRPAEHKRLMLLASSGALGAAAFRVLAMIFGFSPGVAVAGILAPNVFILASMGRDYLQEGRVHRVFRIGLPLTLGTEIGLLFLSGTAGGEALRQGLALMGRVLGPLY